jgi:hypothetical protein
MEIVFVPCLCTFHCSAITITYYEQHIVALETIKMDTPAATQSEITLNTNETLQQITMKRTKN